MALFSSSSSSSSSSSVAQPLQPLLTPIPPQGLGFVFPFQLKAQRSRLPKTWVLKTWRSGQEEEGLNWCQCGELGDSKVARAL